MFFRFIAGHGLAPVVGVLLLPLAAAAQNTSGADGREVYTETIPGTTVSFEMTPIPAGKAGDVAVGPLWMGKVEITWDAYDVYVFGLDEGGQIGTGKNEDAVSRPSKPYLLPGDNFGHQGLPALAMTHHAAQAFAAWLSERTGKQYRLPTEAEWEHACLAGQSEGRAGLAEVAWFAENSGGKTHAGATRKPNAFGVADLLGNVSEWVTGADGKPMTRGGAYLDQSGAVSCTARKPQTPAWNETDPQLPKSKWWLPDAPFVGFRLVREP